MKQIIGLGSVPQDRWKAYNNSTNVYRYNGMTVDEYVQFRMNENPQLSEGTWEEQNKNQWEFRNEFWAKRDEAVQHTFSVAESIRRGDSSTRHLDNRTELSAILKNTDVASTEAIIQVQGASKEWRKLDRLLIGKEIKEGAILGYDLETFGNESKGIFGITEIGIGKQSVKNGILGKETGYGFVIGLDENEVKYMNELVTKVRTTGWESLTEIEGVNLERMSMYGGDSTSKNFRSVFSKKDVSGLGEFWMVDSLSNKTHNMETIERGIKYLSEVHEAGATRENVFRQALQYLYDMYESNKDSSVITGGNTGFDTAKIKAYGKMYGIDLDIVAKDGKTLNIADMLKKNTVDVIYATRAVASLRGISISEHQRRVHGKRGGGARVQSIMLSLGFNETETHLSVSDIFQQIKLFAAEMYTENGTLAHDISLHLTGNAKNTLVIDGTDTPVIKNYSAKNSLFLLNRGWLDKNSGGDIALILTPDKDGNLNYEATQNYTISGEYWEYDERYSGYTDDKYYLALKSTADDTVVIKQFDDTEKMGSFLRDNASWFKKDDIVSEENETVYIDEQKKAKYRDTGARREFERVMDSNSVSVEKGKQVGGFASMEEFLKWDDEYGNKYEATPEGFRKYIQDQRASGKQFKINQANTMQKFLGVQEKIAQENTLLKHITKQINAQMGNADNMTKTIALRKAYESALKTMSNIEGVSIPLRDDKQNIIANDIFGIDVRIKDKKDKTKYKDLGRINTYDVDFATKDISRIFTSLTKPEAIEVLEDFKARKILSKKQFNEFRDAIMETGVDAGGDVKKAYNIGKYLQDESTYMLYTDIGYALHNATKIETEGNVIAEGQKKKTLDSSPQFTLDSYSRRLYDNSNITFVKDGVEYNVNRFYGIPEVQKAVNAEIANNITSTPRVIYYDKDYEELKRQLRELSDKLNYKDDISFPWVDKKGEVHTTNLLESMFFSKKEYGILQHEGIHTYIIQPEQEGKSAYMLFTNDKNQGKTLEILSNMPQKAFDSYSALSNSEIADYAGIYELPYINRYTIQDNISEAMSKVMKRDSVDLTVIKQSENSEKFLTGILDVYEKDGRLNAYMNNGVYDYISAFRMGGKESLPYIKSGDFKKFTSSMRGQQNSKLKDLSGSASYRGYIDETGKVVRITNYGPGDYMYAYQSRIMDGMHEIFKFGLSDNDVEPNDLDKLVDAFADEFGVQGRKTKKFRQRIADQVYFKEFFGKNLFIGSVNIDPVIRNAYGELYKDKNIFSLLKETVDKDSSDLFNSNVRDALDAINGVSGEINQIGSVTFGEKGYVTFGIHPGDYNVNAFLYNTMRPLVAQQNLGRLFNPEEEWNKGLNGEKLEIQKTRKITRKDGTQFRMLNIIAGSPEVTVAEYLGKKALSGYQKDYDKRVRHIMTPFKQMNDFDLQMKYRYMYENATSIAKDVGLSEKQYRQYLDYMREDMLSVNEGKWFTSSLIAEQRLIKTNDAKKVFGFHLEDIDEEKTRVALNKLKDKEVTQNDIIGIGKNGKNIYYHGAKGKFTSENIKELLETGETRIIPTVADIIDMKVIFNGSEKATAHAVSATAFMKYADAHGIAHGTREEVIYAFDRIFNVLSDGAGFIGALEFDKHGGLGGIDNLWRVLTTNYVLAGKGQQLVNYLNEQTRTAPEFAGIPVDSYFFDSTSKTIISNAKRVENPIAYLMKVWNDVENNVIGHKSGFTDLNKQIVDQVRYMQERDIVFGTMSVQNQNEHVSDGIGIDKRMEQAIRERVLSIKNGGKRWDLEWANELNEYSENYDAKGPNKGQNFRNIQKVFDYFNQQTNIGKIANRDKRKNMERGLHGIIESIVYYNSPEKIDVNNTNIVKVNLQELMSSAIIPSNGVRVETLHSSLFFEDGSPSEMLRKLARTQHKHFGTKSNPTSYSLYVDLGDFVVKAADGKQNLNGFLIPIQTAITGADTTMFQTQQSIIASSLSKVQKIINNPKNKTSQEITSEMSTIVGDMYTQLFKQLATQNKDSDYYKIIQKHFMPNSGGLLAEQQVGPLFTQMTDDEEFVRAVNERNELERKIIYRGLMENADEADIAALNERYEIIEQKAKALADEIRGVRDENGNWIKKPKVMNFTALKGTRLEGLEKQVLDGTEKYSIIGLTGRKAFEEQGFNFGKFGMDILYDYENSKGKNINKIKTDFGTKELYSQEELVNVRKKIMKSINEDASLDIEITDDKTMIKEINDWLGRKYDIKTDKDTKKLNIDIETLNNDIAANGPVNKLLAHFDSVGEDYMKKIGIVSEVVRYPVFRSQFAMRVLLSDHIEGNQFVSLNPGLSLVDHGDHDGDLRYMISKLAGGAPALSGKTYDISKNVYMDGLDVLFDLLTELTEDMDAIKSGRPNNFVSQAASMMEKFYPDIYAETLNEYMKEHGLEEITKGSAEELAARSSRNMLNAYSNIKLNTLTNPIVQKSSLAAILRKGNIGRISTPNFTARNMVIAMHSHYSHLAKQETVGASETAGKLSTILNALTNMESKKGGLFDSAEQTAIDPKHATDAVTTAQIARYSTGMNMLFGKYAKNDEKWQRQAITHMVSAIYNNVFTKTQETYDISNRNAGIKSIVDEIMAHKGDLEYFTAANEEKLGIKIPDRHLKHGFSALLALHDIDKDSNLSNLIREFTSIVNQGRLFSEETFYMDKAVAELMEDYRTGKYDSFHKNTFSDGFGEFVQQSFSAWTLQIDDKLGYVKLGTIDKDYSDYVYSLKDSGVIEHGKNKGKSFATFEILRYDRESGKFVEAPKNMQRTYWGINDADLNKKILAEMDFQIKQNTSVIKNLKHESIAAAKSINQKKQARLLSDIVLDKEGRFAGLNAISSNIQKLDDTKKSAIAQKFGTTQFKNVRGLFGSNEAETTRVVSRTAELGEIYNYARDKRIIGKEQVQPNDLIESINHDTATHPERYKAKNENGVYTFSKLFDEILEERFISEGLFENAEHIKSIQQEKLTMFGFDSKAFSDEVLNIRKDLHNVGEEIDILNKAYDELAGSNDYRGSTIVTQALEERKTVSDNLRDAVNSKNVARVKASEDKIYGLFKNRTQLDAFFGLNNGPASGNTMVAFGEYIGYRYQDLSRGDIFRILSSSSEYISSSSSDEAKYAAEKTAMLLREWSSTVGVRSATSAMDYKAVRSDLLGEALKEVDNIQISAKIELEMRAQEQAEEALESAEEAGETAKETAGKATSETKGKMKKHTVRDELFGGMKKTFDDLGIKGKHVGIAVASMAALGIVNNLLHGQKNGSPLTPGRKPNGKGSPDINGNYPDHPNAEPQNGAPYSTGNKVVYHDRQSGLNFRVSAKTAQNFNARQQGTNVGTLVGGQTNVNVYQDNSGVTDNWLANKFAELS